MALPFVCLLLAGILLTVKSRFVQLRALGRMGQLLRTVQPSATGSDRRDSISPRAALLTAMSTTIGVGNVVGPIVAIGLGGPGALLCYVLATLLGGATIFSEVSLAMQARRVDAKGYMHGGPMAYLGQVRPILAPLYALACGTLLLGWTAANANTIAMTLGQLQVPRLATGVGLAVCVLATLAGGIGRIARLNEKLVPVMCTLYCAATCYIVFVAHIAELPHVMRLIWQGFWHPAALSWGVGVSSVMQVLRHGLARALQANEAGVGTATIPHSLASTTQVRDQATLAMAAVYFNGLLCLLTGLTVLVALPPGMPFDVVLLSHIFADHFSSWGSYVLGTSIFLFAFGTILGNSFNGGHCVTFLAPGPYLRAYYAVCGAAVFAGAMFDLGTVFAGIDYLIVPVVVLNAGGVVVLALRGKVDYSLAAAPERKPVDKGTALPLLSRSL